MKNKGYKNLNDLRNADGPYTIVIGPRGVGRIRYFIEQQMKGETAMTNDFYKGMLEGLKNAKSYAEVVKKNFANVEEIYATNSKATPEMIAREQGAQVGLTKMIEYFDLFVEFLKGYDDDSTGNKSN